MFHFVCRIIFFPLWIFHAVVARGRFSLPAPSVPHSRHVSKSCFFIASVLYFIRSDTLLILRFFFSFCWTVGAMSCCCGHTIAYCIWVAPLYISWNSLRYAPIYWFNFTSFFKKKKEKTRYLGTDTPSISCVGNLCGRGRAEWGWSVSPSSFFSCTTLKFLPSQYGFKFPVLVLIVYYLTGQGFAAVNLRVVFLPLLAFEFIILIDNFRYLL